MPSNSKRVFYQDSGYPIKRNLLEIPLPNYTPQKKMGVLKVLNHIYYKLRESNDLLSNTHWELFKKTNGLWHFWNGVSFGKTPWVVTYETSLPRWHTDNRHLQKAGVRALASEHCKKLIAISQCTKEYQLRYLSEQFPSFKSQIAPKIDVIHPPQEPLINSFDEKDLSETNFVFTIVGACFFRKGGTEILHVFDRLIEEKARLKLNIISTLEINDYASKATEQDRKEAKKIIRKHPDHIHHFEQLPNKEVLHKLKNTHVGLLPSYGDTYGYSVLEAQACGCPVITTNIRALPEINDNECGWMINVPKTKWGRGVVKTAKERSRFSAILQENLYHVISNIISNPDQIARKGRRSLNRIKQNHNPEDVAQRLEQIYDEALQ